MEAEFTASNHPSDLVDRIVRHPGSTFAAKSIVFAIDRKPSQPETTASLSDVDGRRWADRDAAAELPRK
jgi:hypothetical protein